MVEKFFWERLQQPLLVIEPYDWIESANCQIQYRILWDHPPLTNHIEFGPTKGLDLQYKFEHFCKNILTEHEKKISNSKKEVKEMISKANAEAEKNVIKTNEEFHILMDSRKKNAEERIRQLKNQALKDIKNASVKIAIESVEKLIKNSLDKSKLDKIYNSSLEETKLALKKKSS